jgi:hypothetical protein
MSCRVTAQINERHHCWILARRSPVAPLRSVPSAAPPKDKNVPFVSISSSSGAGAMITLYLLCGVRQLGRVPHECPNVKNARDPPVRRSLDLSQLPSHPTQPRSPSKYHRHVAYTKLASISRTSKQRDEHITFMRLWTTARAQVVVMNGEAKCRLRI